MSLKCFVYRYMYDIDKIALPFTKDLDLDYVHILTLNNPHFCRGQYYN